MKARRHATDHRALVLESVATAPRANRAQVLRDCVSETFPRKVVESMLYQLQREGLLQSVPEDALSLPSEHLLALTSAGLAWLTTGQFDRALPVYAERPGARRRRLRSEPK